MNRQEREDEMFQDMRYALTFGQMKMVEAQFRRLAVRYSKREVQMLSVGFFLGFGVCCVMFALFAAYRVML